MKYILIALIPPSIVAVIFAGVIALKSQPYTESEIKAGQAYQARLMSDYASHNVHRAGVCPDWHLTR
jgi:hypothetical protein